MIGILCFSLANAQNSDSSWPPQANTENSGSYEPSLVAHLVSPDQMETEANQEYHALLQNAAKQHALAPSGYPQLVELRKIAARIIPYAATINPRAKDWKWEVNLIGSKEINAFCMPGGKIVFYTGMLKTLNLTEDEIAAVMGHEMTHALKEHARERMGKSAATNVGISVLSSILHLGFLGQQAVGGGAHLLNLQFSRTDETEADLIGIQLAARAGFNPQGAISLWEKMNAQQKNNTAPEWLSTHPANDSRITEIQNHLPEAMQLYEEAKKKDTP